MSLILETEPTDYRCQVGLPVTIACSLSLEILLRCVLVRKEGELQVELAQLEYLLPRLVGQGKTLSRLGGGIGTRGPGETKGVKGKQTADIYGIKSFCSLRKN